MPRRSRTQVIGLIAALCLVLSACGSDESDGTEEPARDKSSETADSGATDDPSTKPDKPAGTTIDITFEGDSVDPSGVEKSVKAGKPITLHIVADQPGELHVHSSPEQEIQYAAGTSNRRLTIDRPGIVEVESHDLEQLIVVLEVR